MGLPYPMIAAPAPHRLSFLRFRRWMLSAAGTMVMVLSAFVLCGFVLARAAPAWWRTVLREDPATVRLAERAEQRLITAAHDTDNIPLHRQADGTWRSDKWQVEVKAAEVNAWLNVRLPKWLANQKDEFHWPPDVSDVQVEFHNDRITLGARVRAGERHQVLTATLAPKLDEHGSLYLPARSVNLGRLNIPASWVLSPIRSSAQTYIPPQIRDLPETDALFRAFDGREALVQRALVRLDDGRRIRILKIQPQNGRLLVTCQTER
jgi:uncharacterized protein YpmS